MPQRALHISLRSASLLACVTMLAACSRSPRSDPDVATAGAADSVRTAQDRSRSSATQSVDFTPEQRARFTRVEHMIQAHFSGVTVTNVGSTYSFRIRGTSSFGSNEPLIIIDGASRSAGELSGLNPREIVRIEVVKDAAAFYGVRGANGVIIITTRRSG